MEDESKPAEPNDEPIATETDPTPNEAGQNTAEEAPPAEVTPAAEAAPAAETAPVAEAPPAAEAAGEVSTQVQEPAPSEEVQQIEGVEPELPQEGSVPEGEERLRAQKKDRVTIDVPESTVETEGREATEATDQPTDLRRVGSAVGRTTSSDLRGISKSGSLTTTGEGIEARKSKSSLGGLRDQEMTRSKLLERSKLVVGSVISVRALSTDRIVFDKKGPRYMNTYKLWSDHPFNPEKVQKILETVMTETFEHLCYEPELCAEKAKFAAAEIRQRVKDLEFDRYKIICVVTIGEKNSQEVTARGLWDVERDRYAFFTIETTSLFGVAQCYGIYYE